MGKAKQSFPYRAYQQFVDVLYGVVVGLAVARFADFHFLSLWTAENGTVSLFAPFVLLYVIYLLKLTLFWLGSRNSLHLLSHYIEFELRGYHYLGTIASALLMTQVIFSTVIDCSSPGPCSAVVLYFLLSMTLGIVVGDAAPTLLAVIPKVRALISKVEVESKEIRLIRYHYLVVIRNNALINLAIVLGTWSLFFVLGLAEVTQITRLYSLTAYLLVVNVFQELYLWRNRENQLRGILTQLAQE